MSLLKVPVVFQKYKKEKVNFSGSWTIILDVHVEGGRPLFFPGKQRIHLEDF